MKKATLTVLSILMGSSCLISASELSYSKPVNNNDPVQVFSTGGKAKAMNSLQVRETELRTMTEAGTSTFHKPLKAAEADNAPTITDVIMEVDGRKQNYLRYGSGFFPYFGQVYQYDETTDPSPSSIWFGDDNTIYFEDLMDFGWYSFIKGEISGSKITVALPQTIFIEKYEWADEPYYNNLCVMTQSGSGQDLTFKVDTEVTSVTYTINANGDITLDPLPAGKALGVMTYFIGKVYDEEPDGEENPDEEGSYHLEWLDAWSGAADFTQRFSTIDVDQIEMPKDAEIITYHCGINGTNYPVEVAFQDNYMYIKGISDSPYLSNLVVRATIDGERAYIPQDQFVGVYGFENEMIITKCGYRVGQNIRYAPSSTSYEFTIDSRHRFLQAADSEMYFCFAYMRQIDPSTGQNGLLTYFKDFVLLYQDSYPGVPSDPYNLYAHDDYWNIFGYFTFVFEIAAISPEHHMLLSGNLYYSIYIDDDLVEFEYDPDAKPFSHYYMLPEPTTEIPYLFDNDADLDKTTETEFELGYYIDGITTIGVQVIYDYEGVRTYSNLVTLNIETGEITTTPNGSVGISVAEGDSKISATEYYDLNGRKITNPTKGVFIKKTIMEDGSVKTTKTVR